MGYHRPGARTRDFLVVMDFEGPWGSWTYDVLQEGGTIYRVQGTASALRAVAAKLRTLAALSGGI